MLIELPTKSGPFVEIVDAVVITPRISSVVALMYGVISVDVTFAVIVEIVLPAYTVFPTNIFSRVRRVHTKKPACPIVD